MGYVTSVRVLDSQGRPTKAEVICGVSHEALPISKQGSYILTCTRMINMMFPPLAMGQKHEDKHEEDKVSC